MQKNGDHNFLDENLLLKDEETKRARASFGKKEINPKKEKNYKRI